MNSWTWKWAMLRGSKIEGKWRRHHSGGREWRTISKRESTQSVSHVNMGGVCTRRMCGLWVDGGVVVNRNVEEVCQGGKVWWEGEKIRKPLCIWVWTHVCGTHVESACATPSLWAALWVPEERILPEITELKGMSDTGLPRGWLCWDRVKIAKIWSGILVKNPTGEKHEGCANKSL